MPKSMELTELDKKVLYYQDRGHLVPSREPVSYTHLDVYKRQPPVWLLY